MWFERLLDLQNAYRLEVHQATSTTVAMAIAYGERLLAATATATQEPTAAVESDPPSASQSTHHR